MYAVLVYSTVSVLKVGLFLGQCAYVRCTVSVVKNGLFLGQCVCVVKVF